MKTLLLGLGAGLGISAAVMFTLMPRIAEAQTPSIGAAISQGPSGMWVVYQNRVYICAILEPQVGVLPPTPTCGKPRALP